MTELLNLTRLYQDAIESGLDPEYVDGVFDYLMSLAAKDTLTPADKAGMAALTAMMESFTAEAREILGE